MEYYRSNALYEYLAANDLPQFRFVVGNQWQLVYGDSSCCPLILVLVVAVSNALIKDQPTIEEKAAFELLEFVGKKTAIPVRYIRFAYDVEEVENVMVSDGNFRYTRLTMPELTQLFASFGLPVSNTITAKYLNDKTSSAYHNWQRKSLGSALTVSDIDLWRLNEAYIPEVVFELKRSYYDLSKWQPFTDDYRNFELISNLCNRAGMQFKIIYNRRIKIPFQDIIKDLKIFSVDFSKIPPIREDGIITLEELINI